MYVVFLLVICIIIYSLSESLNKPSKKVDINSEQFYVKYNNLIFNSHIHYKVEGEELFARHCDVCKTIYGNCPLILSTKCKSAKFTETDCPSTIKDRFKYLK